MIGDTEKNVEKIITSIVPNALVIREDNISCFGQNEDLIIIHINNDKDIINMDNTIITLCKNATLNNKTILNNKNTAIVLSSHNNLIDYLIKNNIPTIKVGMLSNDTITYSSKMLNQFVVCLQRDIINFNGELIESKEVCVELINDFNDDEILLGISTLIFLNREIKSIKI